MKKIRRKFTQTQYDNGSLAVRQLSDKAEDYYCETEDRVAEYWDNERENKLYAVVPRSDYGEPFDGDMTLDELEEYLEEMADECTLDLKIDEAGDAIYEMLADRGMKLSTDEFRMLEGDMRLNGFDVKLYVVKQNTQKFHGDITANVKRHIPFDDYMTLDDLRIGYIDTQDISVFLDKNKALVEFERIYSMSKVIYDKDSTTTEITEYYIDEESYIYNPKTNTYSLNEETEIVASTMPEF